MQQLKGMRGTTIRLSSQHKDQVGGLGSVDDEYSPCYERKCDQKQSR